MSTTGAGGARSYNFKIVLLGEGCVGKTSLVLRYVEDKFNDRHITTLQVCYSSKYENIYLFVFISFQYILYFDLCQAIYSLNNSLLRN